MENLVPSQVFILGNLHTRTTWMSRWLTPRSGGMMCYHDASSGARCLAGLKARMEAPGKLDASIRSVGNSDSGLGLFPVAELFPEAALVIIERDPDEVVHSVRKSEGISNPRLTHLWRPKIDVIANDLATLIG